MTDNNTIPNDINSPSKPCFKVGENIIVILDKRIVQKLEIREDNTLIQQQLTGDEILLKVRRNDE